MCTKFQSYIIDEEKVIEDLLARGSCKKCFIAANFDTLPRIVEFFFHMKFLG